MREIAGLSSLYSQAVASRLGINVTDLECLRLVSSGSGMTAGTIAKSSNLTTGATTTVIDRLERAGYVERKSDDRDRRKVVVVASPAMQDQATDLAKPMRDLIDKVFFRYDDEQLDLINRVLTELGEAARGMASVSDESKRPSPQRGKAST
jgi:DNA-binding MarR family transcriptional regulator